MSFITDWTTRIDFDRIRRDRLARVRRMVVEQDWAGLLTIKYENVRYITGMRPLWFPFPQLRNVAVLGRGEGGPILLCNGGDSDHRRATMTWLAAGAVRLLPPLEEPGSIEKAVPVIARALGELGIRAGRVGLDITTLTLLRALERAFPAIQFVDGDEPMRALRLVKTDEEVTLFRASCLAVETGFHRTIKTIEPGVRECEILGTAMKAFYDQGMEIPQCSLIVASGDNLAPIARFASDRVVRAGDLVFMDLGGCFNGMFAEATRTVACERASDEQRRIAACVYDAMVSMVGSTKSGVMSAEIQAAAVAAYARGGFQDFALKTIVGHSIGLAGVEPPFIGDHESIGSTSFELRTNMVFSFEPTIIVPGVRGGGGIRIEDEILVTDTGCEVLTRMPLDTKLFPAETVC